MDTNGDLGIMSHVTFTENAGICHRNISCLLCRFQTCQPRISRGWSSNGFAFGFSHKLPGNTTRFAWGYLMNMVPRNSRLGKVCNSSSAHYRRYQYSQRIQVCTRSLCESGPLQGAPLLKSITVSFLSSPTLPAPLPHGFRLQKFSFLGCSTRCPRFGFESQIEQKVEGKTSARSWGLWRHFGRHQTCRVTRQTMFCTGQK